MLATAALIVGLITAPPVPLAGAFAVEKCEWVTDNFVTCQIIFSPEEIAVMTNENFNILRDRVLSRYVVAGNDVNYRRARRIVNFFPHR